MKTQARAWGLWKWATALLSSVERSQVDLAMDPETRSRIPWRWRVWGAAWLAAVVAYLPIALLLAATLAHTLAAWLVVVTLYGPLVVLGALALATIIRGVMGPEVPIQSMAHTNDRPPRSLFWLRLVAGICLLIFTLGQLFR